MAFPEITIFWDFYDFAQILLNYLLSLTSILGHPPRFKKQKQKKSKVKGKNAKVYSIRSKYFRHTE